MRQQFRLFLPLALLAGLAWAQQPDQVTAGTAGTNSSAPLTITLQDALARAKANEPQFRAALTNYAVAKQNTVQSRAGLLPSVTYNAAYLYTQGNGTASGRFIANNAVHEYLSQANVHQTLSLQSAAEYRLARAQEALAKAHAEISTRGLVVTVTQAYYGLVVAQRKYSIAERAAGEAQHFSDITQKLERGGEVSHSDTIKAQLQFQQQRRALQDAQLEMDRSRLELAIMIFPNFNQDFTTVDDMENVAPLPSYQEAEANAGKENPQLGAALAAMRAANQEVAVAWNGFLPSLSLDYFYGIDSTQFAVNGTSKSFDPVTGDLIRVNRFRNLGYSATATLSLPIWNWGAARSKLKSAHLEREQAQVELSFTQRKLVADLKTFYGEAQTAQAELESLRQSADLAAESLRLTTLRYQAGEATALEVVDAQNTLTLAQNAWGDGQVRFRVALANLETLTGSF
jgi:outer membrane protein TolC